MTPTGLRPCVLEGSRARFQPDGSGSTRSQPDIAAGVGSIPLLAERDGAPGPVEFGARLCRAPNPGEHARSAARVLTCAATLPSDARIAGRPLADDYS